MKDIRILVVEDDPAQQYFCQTLLEMEGFEVFCASDAQSAVDQISNGTFHVVLLDLNLPDRDGLELAQEIHEPSGLPLLMMTVRDTAEQRLAGFEAGAVDYLIKPFHAGELMHRLRRILDVSNPIALQADLISFGPCQLSLSECKLNHRGHPAVDITLGEARVLERLMRAQGRTVSRKTLKSAADRGRGGSDKTVDVLISRLRRKLAVFPGAQVEIKAVHGIGYQLQMGSLA